MSTQDHKQFKTPAAVIFQVRAHLSHQEMPSHRYKPTKLGQKDVYEQRRKVFASRRCFQAPPSNFWVAVTELKFNYHSMGIQ